MSKLSKEYLEWSNIARKAQIDTGWNNVKIAAELGQSRQYITAVVNGRKESKLAIAKISRLLGIEKPGAKKKTP